MIAKTCVKCGLEKPKDLFPRRGRECKACRAIYLRAWYLKNREYALAQQKKYRQENPEKVRAAIDSWEARNKERLAAATKEYKKRNAARMRAVEKAWRLRNPDKCHAFGRKWRQANLLKCVEKASRRRARILSQTIGTVSYDAILERDGYVCHICKAPVAPWDMDFDHVIPISKGGPHSMDNIKPSHSHCNRSKNCKLIIVTER